MKNKLTLLLTLLFIAHLFTKCSSDVKFNENELNDGEKIDQFIATVDKTIIDSLKVSDFSKNWSIQLYSSLGNHSIWIKNDSLTSSIKEFFDYLNSDVALNLPLRYLTHSSFSNSNSLEVKEITSVLRCAEFLSLKDTTLINYSENTLNKLQMVSHEYFMKFLKEKNESDTWIEHLIQYKEKNKRLIQFHYALNQFTSNYGVENNINKNIYLKTPEDSLANVYIAQQLYSRNFITDTVMDEDSLFKKLRSFQFMNGLNSDGKLGKNTMNALTETNYSRYLKGIISLDKMRKFPDSLMVSKLIIINIPSYLLHLYVDNENINTSKVIIGTQWNQTPIFTSTMKYIVINPYWNVPYSIASREILPHLKKDSTYLKRNRYAILDKDRNRLSVDSIDWNDYGTHNFPYYVRQEIGSSNSLGLVKLMFPNDKSIYIHDTPSKYLFAREERTFSHGCIRAESPFKLVNDILYSEHHPYLDSIEVLKQRSKETYLMLNEIFPVTIVYHTAEISDSTHQVQFYKDVYKKEEILYNLFPKPSEEL